MVQFVRRRRQNFAFFALALPLAAALLASVAADTCTTSQTSSSLSNNSNRRGVALSSSPVLVESRRVQKNNERRWGPWWNELGKERRENRQTSRRDSATSTGYEYCNVCFSFFNAVASELWFLIETIFDLTSCNVLCGYFTDTLDSEVCSILCDPVGVDEFVQNFRASANDSVYMCELLDVCPHSPVPGSVNITKISLEPPSGSAGSTFAVLTQYDVLAQTSTSVWQLSVNSKTVPQVCTLLELSLDPGTGLQVFTFNPDPDLYPAGSYDVSVFLCEGECDESLPYSRLLSSAHTTLEVTG